MDETVTAGQLENVIRKAAGANLESIELFDVFTGEQVGEGKKSLAYAVVFRSPSKTLSAEDSDAIRKAIVLRPPKSAPSCAPDPTNHPNRGAP
mgnify:FL=1